MTSTGERPVHERARDLADAGAWAELVELLRGDANAVASDAELRVLLGESLVRTGQERQARHWLESILPSLVGHHEDARHRRALNLLGVAAFALGDLDAAHAAFTLALEHATQADDILLLARASNNLGAIANLQARHESALLHYRIALPAYQRLGQRRGLAETYHNLAITYRDLGSLAEADEHERRAIDYAADEVAPRVAAMGRLGRAEVALRRGDPRLAEETARRAAEKLHDLDDPLNEADAYRLVGTACTAMDRFNEAHASFERALSIAASRGHAIVEAETRRDRADAFARMNDVEHARGDAEAAIAIFRRLGAVREVQALEQKFV
ncbi:MAG: tetratricopeptide repeat protein [Gemmatimonadaceae bacterium]